MALVGGQVAVVIDVNRVLVREKSPGPSAADVTGCFIGCSAFAHPTFRIQIKHCEFLVVFRAQCGQRLLVPIRLLERVGAVGLDDKLILQLVDQLDVLRIVWVQQLDAYIDG